MRTASFIFLFTFIILSGCESPQDPNRPGDKMDGFITFTDTNLTTAGGFHSVSIYFADSSNPFNRIPVKTDSLKIIYKVDFHYVAEYSMDGIPAGNIFVASTWSKYPGITNEIPIVLGTYGCDTSSACSTHTSILYPNIQGNFRNIISWTDTTKRLN